MKIQTKIKALLALAFAFFMFSSNISNAQCSKIVNQTHCRYKVQVVMYLKTSTGCNQICNSFTALVPAGGVLPIPCGNCVPKPCNIEVTILDINGVPVPPVMADYFNGYQPIPANPCGGNKFGYNAGAGIFEMLP